ncbi:hypothetical protein AJ80_09713 [Polytolypa hystricis UAMH7299]|uniref:Small ribosomal subunit protein mS38 n=1 Tax=Polytolypa hystricis (strain UAMH7299) TaxID=1447883 RepID=A0A2B7WD55_POLH7|nr:hypothetical protein AJ80_09713 [Polytolypa hystricis UAMH7299]
MFSSSMRRVARAPPSVSAAVTPRCSSSSVVIVACPGSYLPTIRSHQRRYSSSKPPVPPNDGSRGSSSSSSIDSSSQSPAKSVSPNQKRDGKASKRRGKDGAANGAAVKAKHDPTLHLPCVPSTEHLHPHDIHVASFFSIHRPISVTSSVPSNANSTAFEAIFASNKSSKPRRNNVIYTLSSAVNAIESALPDQQHSSSAAEESDLRAAVTQASVSNAEPDTTHLDGIPMQDLRVSIQEFAKRLRPFNPPPAPVPMNEAELSESLEVEGLEMEAASEYQEAQQRSYSTVLTIRESTHSDGHKTYEAHTTPLVRTDDMEAPSAYDHEIGLPEMYNNPEQPHRRGGRLRDGNGKLFAISVKRQRKLKIKKHKYKKLMRKTRTLRRKLDKT